MGIVWVVLQNAVEEAATDPEADPTVRAEETVSAGTGRRVKLKRQATYLFAPVMMIMRRAGVDMV